MTARCHNDSCSVEWSEVNTLSGPAYQADVITDAETTTPTIQCGDDGLEVKLSEDEGQILSVVDDGLLAVLPEAIVETLSGNPDNNGVAPGADAASPQSSSIYSWTNSTGRDALVLVSGEFNFNYGILGPSHAYSYASGEGERSGAFANGAYSSGAPTNPLSPFNAMLAMRLLADIGAPPTTSRKACRVGIGGMINVSDPSEAELKTERVPFFWMVRVVDGATLNMKSQAFYEGPSQTVNVAASPAMGAGLTGVGHELWNLQVSAIPI